jgi:hypothetical protein
MRCEARILAVLADAGSCNYYEKEYSYALEYDQNCMRLAQEIGDILKLKTAFWLETTKEEPRLQVLQETGLEAVDRSHRLNLFFAEAFYHPERAMSAMDATALYATYLASATSFSDYANELLKHSAKRMEEEDHKLNIHGYAGQVYAVRTVLQNKRVNHKRNPFSTFGAS